MTPRWPILVAVLAVPAATLIATALHHEPPLTGAALGRHVYISEGCMHCHSQFVRPGTVDEELWGDAHDPEFSRAQIPALIGNRRQGPDLMNVGRRRIREWQRMHLMTPRLVSPHSRMPSYAHLFNEGDPRGEALLDYLDSLGREGDAIEQQSTHTHSGRGPGSASAAAGGPQLQDSAFAPVVRSGETPAPTAP